MVVSNYIKLFCTGTDRHNGICNKTNPRKAPVDEGKGAQALKVRINDG